MLALTGHTRYGSRARVGRYLVGRLTDVEGSLPCRRDVRAVSENMIAGKEKTSSFPANLHARGELSAYDRKIPFPGSLNVVNSYRTTGKSQFQEATVVTFTLIFHMF